MRSLLKAIIFASVLLSSVTAAQTRVVVIPLMGDDAESTWRGSWAEGVQYAIADLVEFDGSSYISIDAHTSNLSNIPPSAEWVLVAASRANGLNGQNGVQGPAGIQGPAGSTGAQGPVGPRGLQGPAGADLYERVIVVNGGGTPAANANALSSAFTQADSLASATSPVLVYIEPGTYADRTYPAVENVYVMGAGRGTNIQGGFSIQNGGVSNVFFTTPDGVSETLTTVGRVLLENIDIEGNFRISAAIGAELTINKLTQTIDLNAGGVTGVSAGAATSLLVESSNISATSAGSAGTAVNSAATTTIRNSTLRGGNGVLSASNGDSVFISDSELRGIDNTVVISGFGANFDIRHSLLESPDGSAIVTAGGGGSATITNSRLIVDTLFNATIVAGTEVCLGNSVFITGPSPSNSFLTNTCQ